MYRVKISYAKLSTNQTKRLTIEKGDDINMDSVTKKVKRREKMKSRISLKMLVICGVFASILAVVCPVSIPIGPIPVTLGTFMLALTAYILGNVYGCIATLVYILIGLTGIPVFSGFKGGMGVVAGVTGGFILGYPIYAFLTGLTVFSKRLSGSLKVIVMFLQGLLGLGVMYTIGVLQFTYITNSQVSYAVSLCVAPFVVKDIISIALAYPIGKVIRRAMKKSKLL